MNSLNREPYLSDLTDAQWQRIEPLLPKPARTGRRRANDREVINGILSVRTQKSYRAFMRVAFIKHYLDLLF
jgi:transposase